MAIDSFPPPFSMQDFKRNVACGIDMNPVILALDPQRCFIGMDGGLSQNLFDSLLLPLLKEPDAIASRISRSLPVR